MPPPEYCVYNETRENLLSFRVAVINTRSEPLRAVKVLIEGLAPNAQTGLWLNPLRSIPAVPRLSPYDLVYLDQDGYIVHGVELVPDDEAPRIDSTASSALLLPIHTFAASRAVPGDRFVLRRADEVPAVAEVQSTTPDAYAPLVTADPSPVAAPIASTANAETPAAVLARASAATALQPLPPPEKLPPLSWPGLAPTPLIAPFESFAPSSAPESATPMAIALTAPISAASSAPILVPIPVPIPAEIEPPSPRRMPRFPLLHVLIHLRIHIHISIATTPGMSVPALSPLSAPTPVAAGNPLTRPLTQLPATTLAALRPRAAQARSFLHRHWTTCKTAYLLWADSFIFRAADKPAPRLSTVPPAPLLSPPMGCTRKPRFLR